MEPSMEEMFRQRQMTFIGKVLARFPHNFQNRLATIKESAGLLSDLLGQTDQWKEEDKEEYNKILSTIDRQVNILARKSQYLNRFAQRMGDTFTTFNPGELVEDTVTFLNRSAHLRRVSLKLDASETLPSLYSDPLRIHFLVSIMINDMLGQVERGGKVIVRVKQKDNVVLIEVQGFGIFSLSEGRSQYWPTGQRVISDLGGRLETSVTSDMKQTSLFLPIKRSS